MVTYFKRKTKLQRMAPLPLQALFSAPLAPLLTESRWHQLWQQHLLLPQVLGLFSADLVEDKKKKVCKYESEVKFSFGLLHSPSQEEASEVRAISHLSAFKRPGSPRKGQKKKNNTDELTAKTHQITLFQNWNLENTAFSQLLFISPVTIYLLQSRRVKRPRMRSCQDFKCLTSKSA